MRDVILAAAGQAADETPMHAHETSEHAELPDDMTVAQARSGGETEGVKKGSASERTRIKSIITSDQAKGREELAHYFAFDTDLAADTVLTALAKSPAAKITLDNAMALEAQPKLGTAANAYLPSHRALSTPKRSMPAAARRWRPSLNANP